MGISSMGIVGGAGERPIQATNLLHTLYRPDLAKNKKVGDNDLADAADTNYVTGSWPGSDVPRFRRRSTQKKRPWIAKLSRL